MTDEEAEIVETEGVVGGKAKDRRYKGSSSRCSTILYGVGVEHREDIYRTRPVSRSNVRSTEILLKI